MRFDPMELFMTGELLTVNSELHLSAWFDQALAAVVPDTMAFNLHVVELEHLLSGGATARLHGPGALSFMFPVEYFHDGHSWDDITSYLVAHMCVPADLTDLTTLRSFKDSLAVFCQKVVGLTGWVHGVRIAASIVLHTVRAAGSSSGVQSLKRFTYAELLADGGMPGDNLCPICLEQLDDEEEDEFLTKTPCKHVFHHHCLARWLNKSCACPMCRFEMSVGNDDYVTRSCDVIL